MGRALTIKELMDRKQELAGRKNRTHQLDTPIGTVTVKQPTTALVVEAQKLDGAESDFYLIYESMIQPNLKDKDLQAAYGCVDPMSIVSEIFLPGEIAAVSKAIMLTAGFGTKVEAIKKQADDLKN